MRHGVNTHRPDYLVVEHPSDVGFELWAGSRGRLYEDAVLTYYDMLVGLDRIACRKSAVLEVEGRDDDDLMVALLSHCIYMTEVDRMLFREAHIEDGANDALRLRMRLEGESIDVDRHPFEMGFKAVTYHYLEVARQPGGRWRARVVFDI